MAFLTTQVQLPDQDDYKKFRCTMKYLHATKHLLLVLEADNLQLLKCWVNGAFATHNDRRSHTGSAMSLGKGQCLGCQPDKNWKQVLQPKGR